MEFEEACSEVDFILQHLNNADRDKIPESIKKFFAEHKSIFYKVNIDENKSLSEQSLKDETKAFLKILYNKYCATEKEKNSFINMLNNAEDINETGIDAFEETQDVVYNEKSTFSKLNLKEQQMVGISDGKTNKIVEIFKKIIHYFNKK